jgi:hypothetical protein
MLLSPAQNFKSTHNTTHFYKTAHSMFHPYLVSDVEGMELMLWSLLFIYFIYLLFLYFVFTVVYVIIKQEMSQQFHINE